MKISLIKHSKNLVGYLCNKLEKSILKNKSQNCRVVFGPVYSRRLGMVLGINNSKPGTCSYNCVYCPGGKKSCCSICTSVCLSPLELNLSVKNKLTELERNGRHIDYILFAGSGDPCLDLNLGKEILFLREFGYKVAVYTNAALLWNKNIQQNLMFADFVSVKVDTVNEETWLKMNRPHQRLRLENILNGIEEFAHSFGGTLVTETNLIKNMNDSPDEILAVSNFIDIIPHHSAYFMTPVYPPSEEYAVSPDTETLKTLSAVIKNNIPDSVLLCCPKKDEFCING